MIYEFTSPYIGLYNSNTQVGLRAMIGAVAAAFTTLGWVRTADAGQLAADGSNANYSSFENAFSGFHIFHATDALQSDCPLFVRVNYGSGAHYDQFGITFTIGRGTDGNGNIIAAQGSVAASGTANAPSSNNIIRASDGPSSLYMVFGEPGSSVNNRCICIDRSRNASGDQTADGAVIYSGTPSSLYGSGDTGVTFYHYQSSSYYRSPISGGPQSLYPDISSPMHQGTDGAEAQLVFPVLHFGEMFTFLMFGMIPTDAGPLSTFQATVFGQQRTLIRGGNGCFMAGMTNMNHAFVYE